MSLWSTQIFEAQHSGKSLLVVASVVTGALIGELVDLDAPVTRFGEWLKGGAGNGDDRMFVEGFAAASILGSRSPICCPP